MPQRKILPSATGDDDTEGHGRVPSATGDDTEGHGLSPYTHLTLPTNREV
jgi:hypothetical protein